MEKPFFIMAREQWSAMPTRMSTLLDTPVTSVLVTCVSIEPCVGDVKCLRAVQSLQKFQVRKLLMPDIQYNFVIGGNGRVYEGRGWHARATLLRKHRHLTNTSLYCGFMGKDLDLPERRRQRSRMLRALEQLLWFGVRRKFISERFLQINLCKSVQIPDIQDVFPDCASYQDE